MNESVVLFTREGCGLCEQAYALAQSMGIKLSTVDIAGDLALLERYGNHIPVVKYAQNELYWPFTGQDLLALVGA